MVLTEQANCTKKCSVCTSPVFWLFLGSMPLHLQGWHTISRIEAVLAHRLPHIQAPCIFHHDVSLERRRHFFAENPVCALDHGTHMFDIANHDHREHEAGKHPLSAWEVLAGLAM